MLAAHQVDTSLRTPAQLAHTIERRKNRDGLPLEGACYPFHLIRDTFSIAFPVQRVKTLSLHIPITRNRSHGFSEIRNWNFSEKVFRA